MRCASPAQNFLAPAVMQPDASRRCRLVCTSKQLHAVGQGATVVWRNVRASVASTRQLRLFLAWLERNKGEIDHLALTEYQADSGTERGEQSQLDILRLLAGALAGGALRSLSVTTAAERQLSNGNAFNCNAPQLPRLEQLHLAPANYNKITLSLRHLTALYSVRIEAQPGPELPAVPGSGSCLAPSLQLLSVGRGLGVGSGSLGGRLAGATGLRCLRIRGISCRYYEYRLKGLERLPRQLTGSWLEPACPPGISVLTGLLDLTIDPPPAGAGVHASSLAPLKCLQALTRLNLPGCTCVPPDLSALTGLAVLRLCVMPTYLEEQPLSCAPLAALSRLTLMNLNWRPGRDLPGPAEPALQRLRLVKYRAENTGVDPLLAPLCDLTVLELTGGITSVPAELASRAGTAGAVSGRPVSVWCGLHCAACLCAGFACFFMAVLLLLSCNAVPFSHEAATCHPCKLQAMKASISVGLATFRPYPGWTSTTVGWPSCRPACPS